MRPNDNSTPCELYFVTVLSYSVINEKNETLSKSPPLGQFSLKLTGLSEKQTSKPILSKTNKISYS